MTEQRWPIKICITWEHFGDSAPGRSFSASDRGYPDYPVFVRADLAERMADALDNVRTVVEFSLTPCHKDQTGTWIETINRIDSALSAFRSATQDTEAR